MGSQPRPTPGPSSSSSLAARLPVLSAACSLGSLQDLPSGSACGGNPLGQHGAGWALVSGILGGGLACVARGQAPPRGGGRRPAVLGSQWASAARLAALGRVWEVEGGGAPSLGLPSVARQTHAQHPRSSEMERGVKYKQAAEAEAQGRLPGLPQPSWPLLRKPLTSPGACVRPAGFRKQPEVPAGCNVCLASAAAQLERGEGPPRAWWGSLSPRGTSRHRTGFCLLLHGFPSTAPPPTTQAPSQCSLGRSRLCTPTLPLGCCVTLDKSLHLSEPPNSSLC